MPRALPRGLGGRGQGASGKSKRIAATAGPARCPAHAAAARQPYLPLKGTGVRPGQLTLARARGVYSDLQVARPARDRPA